MPARSAEPSFAAALRDLHVETWIATYQGRLLGGSLLTEATRRLDALGMSAATLWALEADVRARAFYERLGWQLDGASNFDGTIDVRYRLALH